jgi:hypothetical protein
MAQGSTLSHDDGSGKTDKRQVKAEFTRTRWSLNERGEVGSTPLDVDWCILCDILSPTIGYKSVRLKQRIIPTFPYLKQKNSFRVPGISVTGGQQPLQRSTRP